jgi:PAS domain S-box-containing protein
MLVYTLVVLLVAMLQGSKMQWVALGLSIGAYLGIGWMYAQGLLPPPSAPEGRFLEWAIPVCGMLVFITFLLWFHTSQFQNALRQAQQARMELEQSETLYHATIESMADAIYVVDTNLQFVLHNTAFERWVTTLGITEAISGRNLFEVFPPLPDKTNGDYQQVFDTGETLVTEECTELVDKKLITEISKIPIFEGDKVSRVMTIIRDITEQKQAEEERGQLQQEVIEAQKQAIQELSTPVIPVTDRIIVMPLVGNIDSSRARDITRLLLAGITEHRADVVIVDITGVSVVDTGVVAHLNKTIQAARLKGARTIVTGISDVVAETIVDLGIDWSEITTLSDLQTGLIVALNKLGLHIESGVK